MGINLSLIEFNLPGIRMNGKKVLNSFWEWIKKRGLLLTFIFIAISLIVAPIKLYSLGYRLTNINGLKAKVEGVKVREDSQIPYNPDKLPEQQVYICENGFLCSDFMNKDDWKGWSGFLSSQQDPRLLGAMVDSKYDNPNLWFQPLEPAVNFDAELTIIPQKDNKINLVITYGKIWRCIFGEANYKTITCEEDPSGRKIRRSQYLSSLGKPQIKAKTELLIKIKSILNSQNKIDLLFQLKYAGEDKQEAVDISFPSISFPVPDPALFTAPIGVGIIDPYDEGIRILFEYFKIHK